MRSAIRSFTFFIRVSRTLSYRLSVKNFWIIIAILPPLFVSASSGADYFVSKDGKDNNSGSETRPFLTLARAAQVLQAGDSCWIDDGIYSETVRPVHSGTATAPIRFLKLNPEGKVVISGLDPIRRDEWERVSGTQFRVQHELTLDHENQVFRGSEMLFEARWPNTGPVLLEPTLATMKSGTTPTLIVDSDLPDYDYARAEIWVHAPRHWSNWTTTAIGNLKTGQLQIEDTAPFHVPRRHVAVEGAQYFVFGVRDALDADNEWFYDEDQKTLYIHADSGDLPADPIFLKRRMVALDLRERAHLHFEGLDVLAATIETNESSTHLVFDRMTFKYPYFSSVASHETGLGQSDKGVRFMGKHCVLKNSEVAYSSGTGVALYGENNQVLNCYIHDHDFIGTYASCVQLGGKGNVISHSTLTRSGRSVIDYADMYQALIQHCDLSHAGMLTSDLGLTYGNVIEGGNSEIRYNLLHDNQGDHLNMGLYFDHGTQNILSHHNIIHGTTFSAFHLNFYASYHLVYNNTFISEGSGFRNNWGNQYEPELNGVRIVNNVFSGTTQTLAPHYHWSHNLSKYDGFDSLDPMRWDESLMGRGVYLAGISKVSPGERPAVGAIEVADMRFPVGHDFANPPTIDLTRSLPRHRNRIGNSAFEHEDHLSPWRSTGEVVKTNHRFKIQIDIDDEVGRMGRHSVELAAAGAEVFQAVPDLEQEVFYQFVGYLRVDQGEQAVLGVRYPDGSEFVSPHVVGSAPGWQRANLSFLTPAESGDITVFVRRLSNGGGKVYFDDAGLVFESRL